MCTAAGGGWAACPGVFLDQQRLGTRNRRVSESVTKLSAFVQRGCKNDSLSYDEGVEALSLLKSRLCDSCKADFAAACGEHVSHHMSRAHTSTPLDRPSTRHILLSQDGHHSCPFLPLSCARSILLNSYFSDGHSYCTAFCLYIMPRRTSVFE
jgi:hypothetical protein